MDTVENFDAVAFNEYESNVVSLLHADDVSSQTVTVTATYRSTTEVPLIGPLVGDVTMTESVTMFREAP